jgi:dihydrofolate synthase/folylpolyglutamate synthase
MAQILFPLFDKVIVAPIHTSRATPLEELLAVAQATGTPAYSADTVSQALDLAMGVEKGEVIVVSGSVYLVGEARTLLQARAGEP